MSSLAPVAYDPFGLQDSELYNTFGLQDPELTTSSYEQRYHAKNLETIQEKVCPICLERLIKPSKNGQIMIRPCGHMFHKKCLLSWARKTCECAVCRDPRTGWTPQNEWDHDKLLYSCFRVDVT